MIFALVKKYQFIVAAVAMCFALSASFYAGWKGASWRADSIQLKVQTKEYEVLHEAASNLVIAANERAAQDAEVAAAASTAIETIRARARATYQEIANARLFTEVPIDGCADPFGAEFRRLYNENRSTP